MQSTRRGMFALPERVVYLTRPRRFWQCAHVGGSHMMKIDRADNSADGCAARRISERYEGVAMRREVEAELEYLREENRLLRDAARFFGELSERLNAQLRKERARRPQSESPSF
jgi:hypothetical protein